MPDEDGWDWVKYKDVSFGFKELAATDRTMLSEVPRRCKEKKAEILNILNEEENILLQHQMIRKGWTSPSGIILGMLFI